VDEGIRMHSEFGSGLGHDMQPDPGIAIAPGQGMEHALASVVLGAVFALAGPTIALLIHILQESHFRGIDRVAVILLGIAGSIGGLFVVVASVFGVVFGIMGMLTARRQRRPIALGLAGVFLTGLDAIMWLGLLICWLFAVVNH
jgi:hypothetical protein